MPNIKVSVIVPAYNVEPWIEKCLKSICEQTYRNLEILVINDGSTDHTGRIIEELAACDSRIKAIHQENSGLISVRELGIELATGEYVGFVDGDDTIEPDMYERLLKNALKYDADISHCGMLFILPDGKEEYHYGTDKLFVHDNFEGLKALLEGQIIEPSLCSKLYRRELLFNSCLDQTVLNNEDLLRNFVVFNRSRTSVYEDFCGYRYAKRDNSMSMNQSKALETAKHIFQARKLIMENADPAIKPYAISCWLNCVINSINRMMFSDDPKLVEYCEECRQILIDNHTSISYLVPRRRFSAVMAIRFPGIYKTMHRINSYRSRR